MKKISKKQINTNIKTELDKGRQWCYGESDRYYRIMIDTDDAQIWAECMMESSWIEHHDKAIMHIEGHGATIKEEEENCTSHAVALLEAAGWAITE